MKRKPVEWTELDARLAIWCEPKHRRRRAQNGAKPNSAVTGVTGMGLDGVGWGTLVTGDRVWISGFNGEMLLWI
jgi:hypothetical protein